MQLVENKEQNLGDELDSIKPGSHVRLQLSDGVRFLAEVIEARRRNGTYRAKALHNVLPVKVRDLIVFEQRHVFGVM